MSDHSTQPVKSLLTGDRLRRSVSILFAAIFAGLVVLQIAYVQEEHSKIISESRDRAENLAHVLSEHLVQKVASFDAALSQIALHSERVGGPNAQPDLWAPILRAALAGLTAAGSISITNDAGMIVHSTIDGIVGQSRSDSHIFRHLKENPAAEFAVDTPYHSPRSELMLIPFGRRLLSPEGEFAGIAVVTLMPEQLRQFYRAVDLGMNGRISVLHSEGVILFSEPSIGDVTGKRAPDNPLFEAAFEGAGNGFLRAPLESGGRSYLTAYRTVRKANVILAVSMGEDRVFATLLTDILIALGLSAVLGGVLFFAGYLINREIRARAHADAALKVQEARFQEIMYHAPVFVSVKDTKGRIEFINKALEGIFGLSNEQVKGKRLDEIVSVGTDPRGLIASLDQEVIDTNAPLQRELSYQSISGTRTALFVKFPLLDVNGNVESVASFSTDLTEQRRAAAWFRTVMDHAPVMITLKETDGRFVFVNRAQAEAAGRKVSDFLGRRGYELFPKDYAALHAEFDNEVIVARAPIQREFQAPYANGVRTLLFVKFPVFDAEGNIESIGSIATDISDQKQAEKQLVHAQRMESLGQLTGGIAHDFNNLLTVMIGNSELLTSALAEDEKLEPLARMTLEAAERSAALTQRLLAFGRRQTLEPKATNIGKLVDDMHDFIERAAGVHAKVKFNCSDDLWPAHVDPGQLETAILNLVVNARDAMPDGGSIVIDLANAEIGEDYLEQYPDAGAGEYVTVSVSDTGCGMPPEVMARVFEPFFTTKEAGKGTGLGLPTIYGFVKQSGGHVKIDSTVGQGTVVRLYLPRAGSPGLVPALPDDSDVLPRGQERILLVEDDRAVRIYTEGQLLDLGYRVATAASAGEALKLAHLTGQPDLLVTDIVMAGSMNGRQFAERMRERWPDIKILYVSGYADGVLPELVNGRVDGAHFLAKPFRRRDLAFRVREALDADIGVASFTV